MKVQKYGITQARKDLPRRSQSSHKGTFGKVLIVAGSSGTWGAGLLACRSALRAGAGYVYWASEKNPEQILKKLPEVLTRKISDIRDWQNFDAILIGPGLGIKSSHLKLLQKLKNHPRVILDADMLTILARSKFQIPPTWILTPHPGEMGRLLKTTAQKINTNRRQALQVAVHQFGCVILLKGFRSLVSNGKAMREIQSGNAALAKAGSGDVLGGMIAAFLAQGLDSYQALSLASFVHGFAADLWTQKYSDLSLLPSEICDFLPQVFKKLSR